MLTITNKLKSIELFEIEMPLVHPFQTSFALENHKQAIIIKVTDTEGLIGWGETSVSTNPGYCYETTKTAWHIQQDFLIPRLDKLNKQQEEFEVKSVAENWSPVRGHEFAKSGIEAALLVLAAEQQTVSLGNLYNATKSKIPTGVSIGIQKSIKVLKKRIQFFLDQGYHRIKIKIEPGWDAEVIKSIRQEFGDIQLMVDANSAYTLNPNDLAVLQQLDKFEMMMIEQPLAYNDILQHKTLQAQMQTPICLDESIHNPRDAILALENDCCRIINIKAGRVGGYINARSIAKQAGKGKVWCGGMLETGIGRMHNLFLQASEEFSIPGDTSGSDRYFSQDIIDPPVKVDVDGYVAIPNGVGLGVEVLEEKISNYSINKYQFNFN